MTDLSISLNKHYHLETWAKMARFWVGFLFCLVDAPKVNC